jgi:trans-2,3-dihydro-3-hydroxyanthranilate isomerase
MDFALYDVFCDVPYSGNQAAVVRTDAALTSDSLLILAREFNLPETCVYWIEDGIPHMIFATSDKLINACGHGLLAVLADVVRIGHLTGSDNLDYSIKTCGFGCWKFTSRGPRSTYISARWPKLPTLSEPLPVDDTARLLGIRSENISQDLPLVAVDSGIINGLVPFVDEKELLALEPDFGPGMKKYFSDHGLDDLELYCVTERQNAKSGSLQIRSRNVFPYGVREEPATGSASISLVAALCEFQKLSEVEAIITQGLSRQGHIIARIVRTTESAKEAWLEGRVNLIASGNDLIVPPNLFERKEFPCQMKNP